MASDVNANVPGVYILLLISIYISKEMHLRYIVCRVMLHDAFDARDTLRITFQSPTLVRTEERRELVLRTGARSMQHEKGRVDPVLGSPKCNRGPLSKLW